MSLFEDETGVKLIIIIIIILNIELLLLLLNQPVADVGWWINFYHKAIFKAKTNCQTKQFSIAAVTLSNETWKSIITDSEVCLDSGDQYTIIIIYF